ncbi:porin [Duganella sp. FT3S]|uniref:Porin n=1 Tax=Rugamonas fusca TaxID=2758568 RepID=A0A7W2EKT4_9BURK|nr:porin [Rugamonas fusca]MBA5607738.1 porin [Rugamonas fusca]
MHHFVRTTGITTLCSLCAVASAQSAVTMYGNIDTGLTSISNFNVASGSGVRLSNGYLSPSQLGFRGREDLGGGMTALFNLQTGFDAGTGRYGGVLFGRNAYVGLETSAGTVTIGRQWVLSDDWMTGNIFQPGWTAGSLLHLSGFDATSDLFNNSVKVVTPRSGGLQAGMMYSLDESKMAAMPGREFNAGVNYAQEGYYLAGTFYSEADGNGSGRSNILWTAGGNLHLGSATRLRGGYSDSKVEGNGQYLSGNNGAPFHASVWGVGIDQELQAQLRLAADVLYRRDRQHVQSSTILRLTLTRSLSRRTDLLASVAHLSNRGGAMEVLEGAPAANLTQTGLALIVRHAF